MPNDDSKKLTLGNWIVNWLENYAKPNVRSRTYEKYSGCLKAYILPRYENILLADLRAADLQKHFNRLLESGRADGAGLSTSTFRGTRHYKRRSAHKGSQVVKERNRSTNRDGYFMSIVMPEIISLTVHTGSRQGEVFGLNREDVDFEKSCLFIRRSFYFSWLATHARDASTSAGR